MSLLLFAVRSIVAKVPLAFSVYTYVVLNKLAPVPAHLAEAQAEPSPDTLDLAAKRSLLEMNRTRRRMIPAPKPVPLVRCSPTTARCLLDTVLCLTADSSERISLLTTAVLQTANIQKVTHLAELLLKISDSMSDLSASEN